MFDRFLDHPEFIVLGQLILLPLLTLLSAHVVRTTPARMHAIIVAGLLATAAAPGLFIAFHLMGLGALPALDLSAFSPAATGLDRAPNETARAVPFLTPALTALFIWSGFSVLLLVRLLFGYQRGLSVVRCARRIEDSSWNALLQPLAAPHRRSVELCASDTITSPAISCWSRRVRILLPSTMTSELSPDQIAPILRHELAHLERRDHLWRLLAEIMFCLLPWHPAIWRLRRDLGDTSELACDARVLRRETARAEYAELLLKFAPSRADHLPALSGLRSTGCLSRRIHAILDDPLRDDRTGRPWLFTLGVCVLVLTTATALAQRRPITFDLGERSPVTTDQVPIGLVRALPGELDFGLVAPGDSATRSLRLINTGTAAVTLTHSKAACGCTTIDPIEPRTLKPGEATTIAIELNAPDTFDTERVRTVTFFFEEIDPLVVTIRLMTPLP